MPKLDAFPLIHVINNCWYCKVCANLNVLVYSNIQYFEATHKILSYYCNIQKTLKHTETLHSVNTNFNTSQGMRGQGVPTGQCRHLSILISAPVILQFLQFLQFRQNLAKKYKSTEYVVNWSLFTPKQTCFEFLWWQWVYV